MSKKIILIFLLCFVLGAKPPRSVWTENWQTTANWNRVGVNCATVTPGKLTMVCQSAGLTTQQSWSRRFPIEVESTVRAIAAPGSSNNRYFAGITIFDNTSGDTVYGELALTYQVPPFQSYANDLAGSLVNEYGEVHREIVRGQTYRLKVVWLPSGRYEFYLDSVKIGSRPGRLDVDPVIFILCVSVGENTPNDGSKAQCEFGPITVTGVLSNKVQRLYVPLVLD